LKEEFNSSIALDETLQRPRRLEYGARHTDGRGQTLANLFGAL
jgi:hypothetical protein